MTTLIAPTNGVQPPTRGVATNRMAFAALLALLAIAALLVPDIARAEDAATKINEAGQKAYDLVFTVAYWICGIGVVGGGVAATAGRIEWSRFGQIAGGITVVFSSLMLVDYFA